MNAVSRTREKQEQAIYEKVVYPGSDVLRNKLGIRSQAELDRAEADVVVINEPTRPAFKQFTLAEMKAVHKHLLGDVYDWAGELRTYTTGRNSASFARPEYIESYYESAILKPLKAENYLKASTPEQFAERSAHYACEINAVHPFIDGNGRTTRILLQDLALQAGYQLDIRRLEANKGAWYAAMAQGFERGDTTKLQQEILNAIIPLGELI
ncbi:cell filamentation protein Fic [Betaproteobacteria bacterium]|nr:cell filamentation protein Fic [Betaproteobacteria bacterium]GHU49236.1 cell filamentation protein Fic [Betaproteobacteria bacterium]